MAHRVEKVDFAGGGSLVQLLGLILLFFFPIGTILGVILMVSGSSSAKYFICSDCGNRLEKTASICPTCKSDIDFSYDRDRQRRNCYLIGAIVIIVLVVRAIIKT